MNLLDRLIRPGTSSRYSLEEYAADLYQFAFGGVGYAGISTTYPQPGRNDDRVQEPTSTTFESKCYSAYASNGVVFACQVARMMLFTEARFQFQQMRMGRPGDLFGTSALRILEKPWTNGQTGDLLSRMIQDTDLAGNCFIRRRGTVSAPEGVERLRPDWTYVLLGSNSADDYIESDLVGYVYYPGGLGVNKPIFLDVSEVAHWAPIPDPLATFRGMSWLTPIVREVRADHQMTHHKLKFFEHAATPNLVVKLDPSLTLENFKKFKELMETESRGVMNAYKTMYLGGGADATVVGNSLQQMDFKVVQGAGETRIAAAANVPPIIVGLSEGLQAATYSNYTQARRRFADITIRPLWRSACAALSPLVIVPATARLWYDDRDIPALQEDGKDAADIVSVQATSIRTLADGGFEPDSVVAAVMAGDLSLLQHTGKLSVQLKEPGSDNTPALNVNVNPNDTQPSPNGKEPVAAQ